jgi:hypothetical protein
VSWKTFVRAPERSGWTDPSVGRSVEASGAAAETAAALGREAEVDMMGERGIWLLGKKEGGWLR